MNYAILTLTSTSLQQQMKEITRCVTGAVSSTADLQFADKAASQVVISDINSKWTVNSTLTPIEAGTAATQPGYIISAPCETASKTKFGAIYAATSVPSSSSSRQFGICLSAGTGIKSSITTAMPASVVLPTSTTYSGQLSASHSSSNMQMSWYPSAFNTVPDILTGMTMPTALPSTYGSSTESDISYITAIPHLVGLTIATNKLYLFWNKYCIIAASANSVVQMIGEFPESILITQKTNTPIIAMGSTGLNNTSMAYDISPASNQYQCFSSPGLFSTIDNITTRRVHNDLVAPVILSGAAAVMPRNKLSVSASTNTTGDQILPVAPILIPMHHMGHGVINMSTYTGLYQTVNGVALSGDIITVGSTRLMAIKTPSAGTYLVKISG